MSFACSSLVGGWLEVGWRLVEGMLFGVLFEVGSLFCYLYYLL